MKYAAALGGLLAGALVLASCDDKSAQPNAAATPPAGKTDAGAALKTAAGAVSEQATRLWDSYKAELGTLGSTLESIKTKADAQARSADVDKAVEAVNAATGSLGGLAADARTALLNSVKGSADAAVKKVQDQIARLTGDPEIAAILGDKLKSLRLFE
jgi:ABC-type transporter Mla subunit MlaD